MIEVVILNGVFSIDFFLNFCINNINIYIFKLFFSIIDKSDVLIKRVTLFPYLHTLLLLSLTNKKKTMIQNHVTFLNLCEKY